MRKPEDSDKAWSEFIQIMVFIGGVFVLLALFRIHPPLATTLSIIYLLASLGFVSRKWWFQYRKAQRSKRKESGFAQRVSARLAECRSNEERFRSEGESILRSIRTLEEDLEQSAVTEPEQKESAERIVKELEAEFSLRHAKASFFADAAKKLEELLSRHRLNESIRARRQELDTLRKANFDDEATVEEVRYHLQQDSIQLQTIVELGKDVATSFKAEQAEELRARLEKLRASLDD